MIGPPCRTPPPVRACRRGPGPATAPRRRSLARPQRPSGPYRSPTSRPHVDTPAYTSSSCSRPSRTYRCSHLLMGSTQAPMRSCPPGRLKHPVPADESLQGHGASLRKGSARNGALPASTSQDIGAVSGFKTSVTFRRCLLGDTSPLSVRDEHPECVDPRVRLAIAQWPSDAPRGAVTTFVEHSISRKPLYEIRKRAIDDGQREIQVGTQAACCA